MSIASEITRILNAKADIKSAIEEKGVTVGDETIDTYAEKIAEISSGGQGGYEQGYNQANLENPLYYVKDMSFRFSSRAFAPERSNIVCRVLDCKEWNMAFGQLSGIKTLKIICDTPNMTVGFAQLVRESADLELLDLTHFKCYPSTIQYFAYNTKKLKTISGALDLSKCTATTSAFAATNALENIEFVPHTIPISIGFQYCTKLTHDSLMSIIYGLMDYGVKFYEYDISGGAPACMTWPEMTDGLDTYVVTQVNITDGDGEVYAKSETTGKIVGFYFHREIGFAEEVLNAIKVGTKFVVDTTLEYEDGIDIPMYGDYNSFRIIHTEGGGTTQTLTLGTTNLNKLTDTEKAIATEKGWNLV